VAFCKLFLLAAVAATALAASAEDTSDQFNGDFAPVRYLQQNKGISANIINGNPVEPHSYPHMGLLQLAGQFICGASLLNARHILTAAHCTATWPAPAFSVSFGRHDRTVKEPTDATYRIFWFYKQEYKGRSDFWKNDIAVGKTFSEIKFNDVIQPIALPEDNVNQLVDEPVRLTGWGLYEVIDENQRTGKPDLQEHEFTVMNTTECADYFKNEVTLYDSSVCIFSEESSACSGDSGGPLIYEVDGLVQVGITSYGRSDCKVGNPGVFTRVSAYVTWIRSIIDKK